MSSRIDSIQAPRGAGKAPVGLLLAVASLVLIAIMVGLFDRGWIVALLVPVLAFSVFVSVSVIRISRAEKTEEKGKR